MRFLTHMKWKASQRISRLRRSSMADDHRVYMGKLGKNKPKI